MGKQGEAKENIGKYGKTKIYGDTWKNTGTQGNTGNKGRLINNILIYSMYSVLHQLKLSILDILYIRDILWSLT